MLKWNNCARWNPVSFTLFYRQILVQFYLLHLIRILFLSHNFISLRNSEDITVPGSLFLNKNNAQNDLNSSQAATRRSLKKVPLLFLKRIPSETPVHRGSLPALPTSFIFVWRLPRPLWLWLNPSMAMAAGSEESTVPFRLGIESPIHCAYFIISQEVNDPNAQRGVTVLFKDVKT